MALQTCICFHDFHTLWPGKRKLERVLTAHIKASKCELEHVCLFQACDCESFFWLLPSYMQNAEQAMTYVTFKVAVGCAQP